MKQELKFVCISDTHGYKMPLPQGDVLIHCGDFSYYGGINEAFEFIDWFKKQNFKYKVFVAGNHDYALNFQPQKNIDQQNLQNKLIETLDNLRENNCYYLMNSSIIIEGYKIWGSPFSLKLFNRPFQISKNESEAFWDQKIENGSEIVITHGPPLGYGDQAKWLFCFTRNAGDEGLLKKVRSIKPLYHLFGHIHEGYGNYRENGINFINCSLLDKSYNLVNQPQIFYLPRKEASQ